MRRRHKGVVCSLLATLGCLALAAPSLADGVSDVAILATNSAHLDKSGEVTGDVVVNDEAVGETLVPGWELALDRGVSIEGDVLADSLRVDRGVSISGTVGCNEGSGVACDGLTLPVFAELPTFQEAVVRPGAENIYVAPGETRTLVPGDYGEVTVDQGGTLVLEGGLFNFGSIGPAGSGEQPCGFPCRALLYTAATEVRVAGRFDLGAAACVGPGSVAADCSAPAFPGAGGDAILYIGGTNGGSGGPLDLPPAARLGQESVMGATLYAPFGTVHVGKGSTLLGAVLGRDVDLDREIVVVVDSYFANRPPEALPQEVFTEGASSLDILLEGADPEGETLAFAIENDPTEGDLSGITPVQADGLCSQSNGPCQTDGDCPAGETCVLPPVTSAWVTYWPYDPTADAEDGFVFSVEDPHGAAGTAVVAINPAGDPTEPPPIVTVTAHDAFAETLEATPVVVVLEADAPEGVVVTFTIESAPGGGVTGDPTQVPPSTAYVTYTPNPGFLGSDSFTFEACGYIAGEEVCDVATAQVDVSEASTTQADPQQVATALDTPVEVTLTGTAGSGGGQGSGSPEAALLDGAEIAGNVADADLDGLGDNHNDLPGPVPVLMSSGVDGEGGPGSNGTKRMQIEWDLAGLRGLAGDLVSAQVILQTHRGSVDTLDTYWYAGVQDQDGLLTDADFEAPVDVQSPLAVMQVPDVPPGTDGTFSFDVFPELSRALLSDQAVFSIQGRVDESLIGQGPLRGLEVRTSADGNLAEFLEPQLSLTTPGVVAPLEFRITSLPESGGLFDQFQNPIVQVPATLPTARVTYLPFQGFTGLDAFGFEAFDGVTAGSALVSVVVETAFGLGDCNLNAIYCDQGRGGGGASSAGPPDTEAGPPLTVLVEGPGDVSSNPRQYLAGEAVGLYCSRECTANFPDGEIVALFARPAGAESRFESWGGDCAGSEPMTLVSMHGARRCTATFRTVEK